MTTQQRIATDAQRSHAAMARFHLRVGQADRADRNDYWTIPLFPLPLILAADGTLAKDARRAIGQ